MLPHWQFFLSITECGNIIDKHTFEIQAVNCQSTDSSFLGEHFAED